MNYLKNCKEALEMLQSSSFYCVVLYTVATATLALIALAVISFVEYVSKHLKQSGTTMKIEHTRTQGFDKSPAGTTWWTVGYNKQQYIVKQRTNASGQKLPYQLVEDHSPTAVPISVNLLGNSATVDAQNANFIDITLAVSLAKFIKEETDGKN